MIVDLAFQHRVDAVLERLEQIVPSIRRLRRVPMDMIAAAVAGDVDDAPTDKAIADALRAIAARNDLGPPVETLGSALTP